MYVAAVPLKVYGGDDTLLLLPCVLWAVAGMVLMGAPRWPQTVAAAATAAGALMWLNDPVSALWQDVMALRSTHF